MRASTTIPTSRRNWPSARQFTEAIQCPAICFADPLLKGTLPAIDRLGMPLVTSGQFAYVYKLKSSSGVSDFAVRCFRGYLGDRDQRYRAIQQHLKAHPVAYLSDFSYAPEGILVAGTRYPIIFMQWIEGPTLDLYLEEMVERKEVLLHLAQEWLKLLTALREANVAHGDLQHGNIIVQHGSLRLIDHDGLFVPEMEHWTSSEVGHQHYQHPKRGAHDFDLKLDNFSAIVIYLSLLSLAEQPALWREYHDENLIFTKADFLAPESSSLFAKVRELGAEQRRLADVLVTAAQGSPEGVPCLLDLVNLQSSLPSWMNTPVNLETKTKTREVKINPLEQREHPRWRAREVKARSSLPATPPSSTYQTLFGGPAAPAMASAMLKIKDPTAVWKNAPVLARDMMGKTFLWWYWGIYLFVRLFGLDFLPSLAIAVFLVMIAGLIYGFMRARQIALVASQLAAGATASPLPAAPRTAVSLPSTPTGSLPRPIPSITANDPIIGNTALNIYHLPQCDWVKQILNKNRVTFSSSSEASSAGYKPCQVCSP